MDSNLSYPLEIPRETKTEKKNLNVVRRGNRITIDSALYVLKQAMDSLNTGITLNKLARKRYGSYRDASAVVNRLVSCGMLLEVIKRDSHQIPRVTFLITGRGREALQVFDQW